MKKLIALVALLGSLSSGVMAMGGDVKSVASDVSTVDTPDVGPTAWKRAGRGLGRFGRAVTGWNADAIAADREGYIENRNNELAERRNALQTESGNLYNADADTFNATIVRKEKELKNVKYLGTGLFGQWKKDQAAYKQTYTDGLKELNSAKQFKNLPKEYKRPWYLPTSQRGIRAQRIGTTAGQVGLAGLGAYGQSQIWSKKGKLRKYLTKDWQRAVASAVAALAQAGGHYGLYKLGGYNRTVQEDAQSEPRSRSGSDDSSKDGQ